VTSAQSYNETIEYNAEDGQNEISIVYKPDEGRKQSCRLICNC